MSKRRGMFAFQADGACAFAENNRGAATAIVGQTQGHAIDPSPAAAHHRDERPPVGITQNVSDAAFARIGRAARSGRPIEERPGHRYRETVHANLAGGPVPWRSEILRHGDVKVLRPPAGKPLGSFPLYYYIAKNSYCFNELQFHHRSIS
ncbi:hypothetical protein [Zavarzinia sp.]|uniref:hypothetical protein n=1 Tax=Zavarzinia sp. TaxID=2027920 RepID=UPI003BB7472A